jgi:hypothetical protein
VKTIWVFRRLSFENCPRRKELPHEAAEEFIITRKEFTLCRFCKVPMPSEGRWQVSTEAQD